MRYKQSLERAHSGKQRPWMRAKRGPSAVLTWIYSFREVYKGRCQRTGRVVALKKILVINEKDGVSLYHYALIGF